MRSEEWLVFRAMALALVATPMAADAQVKQPTAKWVVDFDKAQCIASRVYGTDGSPLLAFKLPPLGDSIQIAVIEKGYVGRYARQLPVALSLDGTSLISTTMVQYSAPNDRKVSSINVPRTQVAELIKARSISIDPRGSENHQFALEQMVALMQILDNCVVDLRRVWNVSDQSGKDPPSHLSRSAEGNLQGLLRADDYPGIAINNKQTGTVTLALLIDEKGRVADCTVTRTSGIAVLDGQSCTKIKERAEFEPALDREGKPVKSATTQSITWRLK